jgi:hypothetical protein
LVRLQEYVCVPSHLDGLRDVGEDSQAPAVVLRFPTRTNRLLTKKQLASELGLSTRWVELRMREGMPVIVRQGRILLEED